MNQALTALLVVIFTGCGGDAPALPPLPPKVEAPAGVPAGEVQPLRELVIALTGEVRGEIEACGCPTVPYGGFARRAKLLEAVRAEGVPTFVLDAGDMLLRGRASLKSPDRVERGRAVLDLSLATGLDAWAPGPLDLLVDGIPPLKRSPALSATWELGGSKIFPASTVIERGGIRLGVIGISGAAEGVGQAEVLAAANGAKVGEADTWVVLTNDPATATLVAEGVPGLGAVLSTRGGALDAPVTTSGAPIIETPDRGRYVTLLRVALASDGAAWELRTDKPVETVARERERLVKVAADPTARVDRSRLERLVAERNTLLSGHDAVYVEERPLGSDLDGASVVDARIDLFKSLATRAAQKRTATPTKSGYVSAAACASCHEHEERFMAWTFDPHARAYEPLVARGQDLDVECIACHSTGWAEPGGNAALTREAMRTWKAVQCEACHGPLAGHPGAGVKATIPTVDTCLGCHDQANSPQFDYAGYLARLSCTSVSKRARE